MKNWLTIGQVSKAVGVSTKALRLYEEMGLIKSHIRGENNYRYYENSQLGLLRRLKEFKDLGFSLAEIKGLLQADNRLDSKVLAESLQNRLKEISHQSELLREQKNQIESILSSLSKKTEPLKAQQRRAIMSFYGKISVVVTGCTGLERTAQYIQQYFKNKGEEVPVLHWSREKELPLEKPFIVVLPETNLVDKEVENINADVIVLKNMNDSSTDLQHRYLKLFKEAGPHVTTVVNADDRASVSLAGNTQVKKGRIFYFSKNHALEPQIQYIGGIISNGEDLCMYGFNLKTKVEFTYSNILAFDDEIAVLSSLAAVMTVGFEKEHLQLPCLQFKTEQSETNTGYQKEKPK